MSEVKVKHLPKGFYVGWDSGVFPPSRHDIAYVLTVKYSNYVKDDFGDVCQNWSLYHIVDEKMDMLVCVKRFFSKQGVAFDEFNGLAPTRVNKYMAYEFSALWLWAFMSNIIEYPDAHVKKLTKTFYKRYASVIASVFKKYPNYTGWLMQELDLRVPTNQFVDYAKMEEANWDSDATADYQTDAKAEEFKKWILDNSAKADAKDKMRVENWFKTKKSHKQIFSEIQRVVGNSHKFNSRLALFVERLFNQDGLDYFFEKTGFDSKEDMFMAYFEKLTMFDDDTKKSFIKKYLV